jgi:hypothetical protein
LNVNVKAVIKFATGNLTSLSRDPATNSSSLSASLSIWNLPDAEYKRNDLILLPFTGSNKKYHFILVELSIPHNSNNLSIFVIYIYVVTTLQIIVSMVQHYKGLNNNLENLYESIKQALKDEKDFQIVSEFKGTLNRIPLRSIVAVNKSPKVFAGSLSQISISITGDPNDYAVEVASNAWFASLLFPGAVGFIVGGPIGLAGGMAVGGKMAYEFERHIWKKKLEVVKKESQVQPTIDSIDHYHQ